MKTLTIILTVIVLLAWVAPAEAYPVTERTSIVKVYQRTSQAGVRYCDISLKNGRWLTYVFGAECSYRPGRAVTLVYDYKEVCAPNWRGVRQCSIQKYLVSWY